MDLKILGWNDYFQSQYDSLKFGNGTYICGRVISANKGVYSLLTENGEVSARMSGRFMYTNGSRENYPCVGDWLVVSYYPNTDMLIVDSILKRKSCLKRKVKGSRTEQQIIAANIDIIFVVMAMTYDFNLRKLERFMIQVSRSGAKPVVVLNKMDLCEDREGKIAEVRKVAGDTDIILTDAIKHRGVDELKNKLSEGITAVFFGASGVGKSSLINSLQSTRHVVTGDIGDKTGKGRHTTTWREVVVIPGGGILIDNPGIREVQLWSDSEEVNGFFADISQLSTQCRYVDCTHTTEPGCAVRNAIESGDIDEERLSNYRRMINEIENLEKRKKQKEKKYNSRKHDDSKKVRNKKIKIEDY